LVGALDLPSVLILECELNAVAHAGEALVLDLRELTSIDRWGLHTLERVARCWDPPVSIVNGRGLVLDAIEAAGISDLLGESESNLPDAGNFETVFDLAASPPRAAGGRTPQHRRGRP